MTCSIQGRVDVRSPNPWHGICRLEAVRETLSKDSCYSILRLGTRLPHHKYVRGTLFRCVLWIKVYLFTCNIQRNNYYIWHQFTPQFSLYIAYKKAFCSKGTKRFSRSRPLPCLFLTGTKLERPQFRRVKSYSADFQRWHMWLPAQPDPCQPAPLDEGTCALMR